MPNRFAGREVAERRFNALVGGSDNGIDAADFF
jgi:hypothetical protein